MSKLIPKFLNKHISKRYNKLIDNGSLSYVGFYIAFDNSVLERVIIEYPDGIDIDQDAGYSTERVLLV